MKLYEHIAHALPQFEQLTQYIKSGKTPVLSVGLSDVHKAHFVYAAARSLKTPILLVAADEAGARKLCDDINAMHAERLPIAMLYPAREFHFGQVVGASREFEQQRLCVLSKLLQGTCAVCVCSIEALMQRTIPPQQLGQRTLQIDASNSYQLTDLMGSLVRLGYTRRPQVDGIGQFSVRGGILDVYPPGQQAPVRIELWGDQVDSISLFDPETQRRTQSITQVQMIPAKECLFDSPEVLAQNIQRLAQQHAGRSPEFLAQDCKRLEQEGELLSTDKYLPLAYDTVATLMEYVQEHLVFLSEYHAIREHAKAFSWQMDQDVTALFDEQQLCAGLDQYYQQFSVILEQIVTQHRLIVLDTFARAATDISYRDIISVNPIMTASFSGELKVLYEDLYPLMSSGYCVAILAGSSKAAMNLAQDLSKMGLPAEFSKDMNALRFRRIVVLAGNISAGFEYPDIKFALISTGRTGDSGRRKRSVYKKGVTIRTLDDLAQGDYVVHVSHGIGIFAGIQKMDLHGVIKDYIKIKYSGADTLYVPVTQLDLVSKYIGAKDDGRVKLNKLNSGEWQKTKARVKKACADMADELIQLYAERMQAKGYAFPHDNEWQQSFEAHFDYEETDDQLRCAEEIKRDMEKPQPMDRLLCGDVGFGKTEIAFRAAFKCVLAGKQCAILCPTTILAWQHYQNAIKRFEQYPVQVGLMSRFRSTKQMRETIAQIKTGEVDLLIGTHRMVQKDVSFNNLGLAIIDEEQRFGVAQKEKFKEMLAGVDMLSISATPIPRTLNMAVNGIRDISTIEQPPQDRHPVQTYVVEHDWSMIGAALKKELRRGGQVYYIHNRVETIESCAAKLRALIPDASIGVAHGKMSEDQLSEIWRGLMAHQIDILICTTIIETGVDVKNCNTLIIEQADHFGLAQLYQLRGRVGRSNRRAFAYFTFRQGKVLTEIATKRLSAIREFTTFGSGFRIAMRDLEIRGAGSLLGQKQHGHMEAVGYDMYVRLLKEAVAKKRGEQFEHKAYECLIDVRLDAHIPEAYIDSLSQRLSVYKKIASIKTEEERMDLVDELIDRFGDPPTSVQALLEVALLRNTLAEYGFNEISQKGQILVLCMEQFRLDVAQKLVAGLGTRVSINASGKSSLSIRMSQAQGTLKTLQEAVAVLGEMQEGKSSDLPS